ncbi:MAG: hypothetical protein NC039_07735 [Muribaculaceae bacterium]|nr:hypothetical protein [Muribaculaceae bacterium]
MNSEVNNSEEKFPYEDIINLPHHKSTRHKPMPMERRAAQFAPFAALNGHDDAIRETARRNENSFDTLDTSLEDEEVNFTL